MTQEYTPDTDDAINLIAAGMGVVNQLGIAPVGYPRTQPDAVEAAKRWLAAHDAQIRAEALTLTEEEAGIAAEALDDADDESWYYDDKQQVIRDVLKSVASFRKGPKQ